MHSASNSISKPRQAAPIIPSLAPHVFGNVLQVDLQAEVLAKSPDVTRVIALTKALALATTPAARARIQAKLEVAKVGLYRCYGVGGAG